MITAKLPRATFEAKNVEQSNMHFSCKAEKKTPDCIWAFIKNERGTK